METAATSIFIGWMPYLTLSYPHGGSAEYRIGRARILPDDDVNWKAITGLPRPKHLNIHEGFPELMEDGLHRGDPLYGTLITSEDHNWLRRHIDAVTAVIFFLADFAEHVLPAECFTTLPLEIRTYGAGREDDLISYLDKHSRRVESSRNLFLLPPIAVRGNLRPRRLDVEAAWAIALLDLIALTPEHRLVVAVRQYFRTQFSDPFTSPADEDCALHCSAIEAAIDMDRAPGISERFAQSMAKHFGNEPLFETFFLGLHKARSAFIHGLSVSDSDPENKETQALSLFRKSRLILPLMRLVTQEVIRESLAPRPSDVPRLRLTPAATILRRCLLSNDIWSRLSRLLTAHKAKDTILEQAKHSFADIAELAFEARAVLGWECVSESPSHARVFSAIETCARAIHSLAPPGTDTHAESVVVGTAAHRRDAERLERWLEEDPWRAAWPSKHDPLETLQAITRALARHFDRYGVIRD